MSGARLRRHGGAWYREVRWLRPGRALPLHALMTIFALLIGLVVGAGGVALLLRPRLRDTLAEQRLARDEAAALADEARELERPAVEAEALLQAERGSLDERIANAVRAASAEAFNATTTQFLELAGTRLGATVAPLQESLKRVGTQVEELDRARAQSYGALRQQE